MAWVCRQAYLVLAGVCVLVGATTTYGLAGDLRHAPPARAVDNGGLEGGGWQFFQPFRRAADCSLRACSAGPCQTGVFAGAWGWDGSRMRA